MAGKMGESLGHERSTTKLETVIVLIAFVVVAAVFAFIILAPSTFMP